MSMHTHIHTQTPTQALTMQQHWNSIFPWCWNDIAYIAYDIMIIVCYGCHSDIYNTCCKDLDFNPTLEILWVYPLKNTSYKKILSNKYPDKGMSQYKPITFKFEDFYKFLTVNVEWGFKFLSVSLCLFCFSRQKNMKIFRI